MIVHALAVDYDGTIAAQGRLAPATAEALARVRDSGRRVLLATGRVLPDLRRVCQEVDRLFDAVVAENGAVLALPGEREIRPLGDRPEPALLEALERRGVEFALGTSIIATKDRWGEAALAAIKETGVERTLVFNKGELMLLPGGVTKGTGLHAALDELELSAHNVVGVGDAENDHAFLSLCECAVAVADAIPALRQRADHVTAAGNGAGVAEFVDRHLLGDLHELRPQLGRHDLELGRTADGARAAVAAHGTRLLIMGPPASGKLLLASVLVEGLIHVGRSFCLLDPAGRYHALAERSGLTVLGGKSRLALPSPDELDQLLRPPGARLVLSMSALAPPERIAYTLEVLAAVAGVREVSGVPHWLVIDDAHQLLPSQGRPLLEVLDSSSESVCLVTPTPEHLAADVRRRLTAMAATALPAFRAGLGILRQAGAAVGGIPDPAEHPLAEGEALLARLDGGAPRATRFSVAYREARPRRPLRKPPA